VEQEDVAVARQRRGKNVSAAANSDGTTEEAVFSMQSNPSLYIEIQQRHWKRLKSPRAVKQ
jgi:hypothetical protein